MDAIIPENKNSELELLKDELNALRSKRDQQLRFKRSTWLISIVMSMLILILAVLTMRTEKIPSDSSILGIFGALILYAAIFPIIGHFAKVNNVEERINQIQDELDLRSVGIESIEARAEKQFKLHQKELKRYYDQSLRQSSWIFYFGIAISIIGFIIIGVTLYLISNNHGDNDIIIAVIGGVTGILTNFIALVYFRMYAGTIKNLNEFHNRLVTTNHLHYSNLLVSKIYDDNLRSATWAKLALAMASRNNEKE